MASTNTLEWIQEHIAAVGCDVLEIGSKKYKEHAFLDLKGFLRNQKEIEFVGCDLAGGENVDVMVDLTARREDVSRAFGGKKFDTVFCVSVLEHVPNVFAAAHNIQELMLPGAALFLSVPFVFRYHGYPGDLWRFTPEAVQYLFPEVDFRGLKHSTISTLEQGDWMSLEGENVQKMNRFLFRPKGREAQLERKRAKAAGEAVEAYSLAPSMVNMLGFRK